jgi:hypothetical protein
VPTPAGTSARGGGARALRSTKPATEVTLTLMPCTPLLEEIYAQVETRDGRGALARIFDELDACLLEGNVAAADEILREVDPARLDTTTALGFLGITLQAKERLLARAALVARVDAMLQRIEPERAARLLEGLR